MTVHHRCPAPCARSPPCTRGAQREPLERDREEQDADAPPAGSRPRAGGAACRCPRRARTGRPSRTAPSRRRTPRSSAPGRSRTGARRAALRSARWPPSISSAWFPVSASEWTASASRPAEPVMMNPTNLAMAIPRLARKAAMIARWLPSVHGVRLSHQCSRQGQPCVEARVSSPTGLELVGRDRCRGSTGGAATPRPVPQRGGALGVGAHELKPSSSDISRLAVGVGAVEMETPDRERDRLVRCCGASSGRGTRRSRRSPTRGQSASWRRSRARRPSGGPTSPAPDGVADAAQLGDDERVPRRPVEVDRAKHVDERRGAADEPVGERVRVEVGIRLVLVARSGGAPLAAQCRAQRWIDAMWAVS